LFISWRVILLRGFAVLFVNIRNRNKSTGHGICPTDTGKVNKMHQVLKQRSVG